jgi:hypothetical protein
MLLIDKLRNDVNQKNDQRTECAAGHYLRRLDAPINNRSEAGYRCDVCGIGFSCKDGYYNCAQGCNWDACARCGKDEFVMFDNQPKVPFGDSGELSPGVGLSSESVEIAKEF